MPERPDLRQIAQSLRESLDGLSREALVDILTYVLNEYVVEGPPPLAAGQIETLEDLAELDLAGLISALQTRLGTPGLDLFRVDGDQVTEQTPSGQVALRPGQSRPAMQEAAPEPAPSPTPAPQPPVQAPARAGAHFHEQPMPPPERASAREAAERGRGDLTGGSVGVITPPPPRPRGLSISSRPAAQTGPAAPAAEPPAQPRPNPQADAAGKAPANPPAGQGDKPAGGERKDDDASIRFSLLELD